MKKKWERNCPECGIKLEYTRKRTRDYYEDNKKSCRKCAAIKYYTHADRKNAQKEQWRNYYNKSKGEYTRKCPECGVIITHTHKRERNRRLQNRCLNCVNSDPEVRLKKRVAMLNHIESRIENGVQILPNYNSEACKIIDEYGKKHGYNFQHAENGGEYHIKELGYWVDGYDEEQNVVIEYYENFHKQQSKRDKRRKNEIIAQLGCEFIELKEWELCA